MDPIGRYVEAVLRQQEAEAAVELATALAEAAQHELASAVAELRRLGIPRPVLCSAGAQGRAVLPPDRRPPPVIRGVLAAATPGVMMGALR